MFNFKVAWLPGCVVSEARKIALCYTRVQLMWVPSPVSPRQPLLAHSSWPGPPLLPRCFWCIPFPSATLSPQPLALLLPSVNSVSHAAPQTSSRERMLSKNDPSPAVPCVALDIWSEESSPPTLLNLWNAQLHSICVLHLLDTKGHSLVFTGGHFWTTPAWYVCRSFSLC